MTKQNNLYLWYKNIRGASYGLYEECHYNFTKGSFAVAIIFTGIIFLPPLLFPPIGFLSFLVPVIVGTGKTISDICTRKKILEDNQLRAKEKQITQLTPDEMKILCEEIKKADPRSLSSMQFQHDLRLIDEQCEGQKIFLIQEEMKRLRTQEEERIKKLLESSEIKAQYEGTIAVRDFKDTLVEQEAKKNCAEELAKLAKIDAWYTARKKGVIKKYFMSPVNNGKGTHALLASKLVATDSSVDANANENKDSNEVKKLSPPFNFDELEKAIQDKIDKLSNSCSRSSQAQARKISSALAQYKDSRDVDDYNNLVATLDFQRPTTGQGYRATHFAVDQHGEIFNALFFKTRPRYRYDNKHYDIEFGPIRSVDPYSDTTFQCYSVANPIN